MRNADSGTKAMLEKFLRKYNMKESSLNIIAWSDSGETLFELVKQGVGVSIVSEIAARGLANQSQIQIHHIKDFDDVRYFYLVYNKQKTLALPAKLFLKKFSPEEELEE